MKKSIMTLLLAATCLTVAHTQTINLDLGGAFTYVGDNGGVVGLSVGFGKKFGVEVGGQFSFTPDYNDAGTASLFPESARYSSGGGTNNVLTGFAGPTLNLGSGKVSFKIAALLGYSSVLSMTASSYNTSAPVYNAVVTREPTAGGYIMGGGSVHAALNVSETLSITAGIRYLTGADISWTETNASNLFPTERYPMSTLNNNTYLTVGVGVKL